MTDGDEIRTDRVGLLLDQLSESVALSRLRIDGISDEEMAWEPHPQMWSIRERGSAASPDAFGPGEWVLDHQDRADPFGGGPLSTAAWRVGHLVSMFAGRWHWTFGERSTDPKQLVDFRPDTSMLDQLWSEIDRWCTSVDELADEQLDQPGFSQYPYGLDTQLPFISIVRWNNREAIHHLAEVALLRDLYALDHVGDNT